MVIPGLFGFLLWHCTEFANFELVSVNVLLHSCVCCNHD